VALIPDRSGIPKQNQINIEKQNSMKVVKPATEVAKPVETKTTSTKKGK
jgi:hypothetical protein